MNRKTFGQNLKEVREGRKLDIDFCSYTLKIHRKYLEAIEKDDYSLFESYFQAFGFVQNYLEFLDLKTSENIPKWRAMFYDDFNHQDKNYTRYYKPKKKIMINLNLSLSKLIYLSLTVIIISFISYIGYSFSQTLSNPVLEIYSPRNNDVVEIDLIDVNGKTDSDSVLRINNEKIIIQTDGSFSTSLKLAEGINNFKFSSLNPYGKESVKILTVIYRPRRIEIYNPPAEQPNSIPQEETKPKNTLTSPTKKIETVNMTSPKKDLTKPKD